MEANNSTEVVEGYKLLIGYMGVVIILVGFITLLPLLMLLPFPYEIDNAKYFILTGVPAILVGYLLTLFVKGKEKGQLHKHQDSLVVVMTWVIAIVISAVPFMLTGKYNFTQAVFETTSGYSTTGLSIVDVANCPHIFLMYRSIMLFFGGVGLVLVMMSVLSDSYGMRLYSAEGHSDRLVPNLIKSARVIIAIYSGYILSGTILYIIFGMNWFDALNHSIAALSTGGFSTKVESIGYYNSVPIEVITIVLMLLGSINFLVHLFLIKGKFRKFFGHCEVKFMLFLCAVCTPIFAVLLLNGFAETIPEGIRIAIFQIASAITTTGFQTVPTFTTWSPALLLLMTLLMLIGGGAGSTAGGIKQYRIYILLKNIWWDIRDKFSHTRIVRVNQINRLGGNEKVTDKMKLEINAFIVLYIVIFFIGTFIFTLFGNDLDLAMFEFSSALGTVGISCGITNYDANPVILWTGTLGMFIGRLEIYIVILAFMRVCSDVKDFTVLKIGHK